jgi:hypothetical protein
MTQLIDTFKEPKFTPQKAYYFLLWPLFGHVVLRSFLSNYEYYSKAAAAC